MIREDKTDARHLRVLLADGRLPECRIPPAQILECRALLEAHHDPRREHTPWVERIDAVFFHQGAPRLGEGVLRTERSLAALRAAAAAHLSPAGQLWVATALDMLAGCVYQIGLFGGLDERRVGQDQRRRSDLQRTARGEHVASVTDTASSGSKDGSPRRLDETPTMPSLSPSEAPTIAAPSPALGARRTRFEGYLRRQLFFGDLAAISLAWGLAMLFQSRLRPACARHAA